METLHLCLNGHAIVPRVPGGIWQIMESVKMKVSDRKERGKTGNAAIQDRGESDTDGRVPGEDWLGGEWEEERLVEDGARVGTLPLSRRPTDIGGGKQEDLWTPEET